jgi:membrane-bound lytic murein transglycosylase MltF
VTSDVLRSKRQALLTELVERKVRQRAEQLYAERKNEEGTALGDWLQAESEVIENSPVAPLYWRSRSQYFTAREGGDRSNS